MHKILLALSIAIFQSFHLIAQKDLHKLTAPIVEEGKHLYRLEMASWNGTDLFLANYENKAQVGGYFSYIEGDISKCLFFSKQKEAKVLGIISFDSTYNTNKAELDFKERAFTNEEKEIYTIRQNALKRINSDTIFKTYQNTSLNIIPVISKKEKKVYVLTGPQTHGYVIFGNDYILTFDQNNQVSSVKPLHQNLIPIKYGQETDSLQVKTSYHSHSEATGDFITATDICTLMLYSKYTTWLKHNVVSKKYLNMWDCKKNTLFVISNEVLDKIQEDQKKRQKDKKDN